MGIKILALRHKIAPQAEACRWCGVPERGHAVRSVPSVGRHNYVRPTPEQTQARMWSHLNNVAKVPEIVRLPSYEEARDRHV